MLKRIVKVKVKYAKIDCESKECKIRIVKIKKER